MTALATPPKLQFLDANGAPLVGGKLYTYAAGTTTPQVTYTDYGGGTANANPVILDSRGEASVWLNTPLYKMALYSATDVLIWTVDNIGGFATLAQLAASGGSNLIGFLQAGTGAVATTVQAKLRESVSVKDFGAVGDGVTDDFAAIILARDAAIAGGKSLMFPSGTYEHSGVLNFASERLRVFGVGLVRLQYTGATSYGVSVARVDGYAYDTQLENLWIEAGGNTTALFIQNTAHCVFKNIRVGNSSDYGIYIEGSVLDLWENPVVSLNEMPYFPGIWSAFPKYGIYLNNSAISSQATANTFINPIIEQVSEVGIYLEDAANNTFIGGTSEANTGTGGTWNGVGIVVQANSPGNKFINTFCEANKNGDLICYGNNNEFNNCSMTSASPTVPYEAVKSITLPSGAEQNRVIGGQFYAATVAAGATENIFAYCNVSYKVDDGGTRTQITHTRQSYNSSTIFPGLKPGNVADPAATVLDWYEEGTFTPAFGGSTSDGTITHDIQQGKFTRIGDTVFVSLLVRVAAVISGPTGDLLVRGLPYASSAVPGQQGVAVGNWDAITLPASRTDLVAYVVGSVNYIRLVGAASGLASSLVQSAGLATSTLALSGTYKV
jgi:hypothetical protein